MKPSLISFNGSGQPSPRHIASGHVALLVQGEKKEVVRIELLPPDDFGPRLDHAVNQEALRKAVETFWRSLDVSGLTPDRDWMLDCPRAVAEKAIF
jgi:hypothetical protein